jgi:hypothetical protein
MHAHGVAAAEVRVVFTEVDVFELLDDRAHDFLFYPSRSAHSFMRRGGHKGAGIMHS